jgi:hypothetical protein
MRHDTSIDEAVATARFREMSDTELVYAVAHQSEDYVPRAIELAREELLRRGIADDVVNAEGAALPPPRSRKGKLGTRWLDLYATLLLVSAFGSLVAAVAFSAPWAQTLTIQLPLSVLQICVAQGLRRRKLWGWYMNWALLFFCAAAGVLVAMPRLRVNGAILLVMVIVLNTIYFARRRALFR